MVPDGPEEQRGKLFCFSAPSSSARLFSRSSVVVCGAVQTSACSSPGSSGLLQDQNRLPCAAQRLFQMLAPVGWKLTASSLGVPSPFWPPRVGAALQQQNHHRSSDVLENHPEVPPRLAPPSSTFASTVSDSQIEQIKSRLCNFLPKNVGRD